MIRVGDDQSSAICAPESGLAHLGGGRHLGAVFMTKIRVAPSSGRTGRGEFNKFGGPFKKIKKKKNITMEKVKMILFLQVAIIMIHKVKYKHFKMNSLASSCLHNQ